MVMEMIKIYGKNCIYEAIKAKAKMECIYIEETTSFKEQGFIQMIKDKNLKFQIVKKQKMDALFGSNHQGFGGYREDYQYSDIDCCKTDEKASRVLILDGINDPHNFGAILRSCDAFNVQSVIIPKNRSVSITETVAKVSTGAIEYVPIVMVNNLVQAIKTLKKEGYWIVGTDASATTLPQELDKDLKLAIVIGSEGFGMSRIVKQECDYMIQIPMKGHVNSLNASVSAGIVLAMLNK